MNAPSEAVTRAALATRETLACVRCGTPLATVRTLSMSAALQLLQGAEVPRAIRTALSLVADELTGGKGGINGAGAAALLDVRCNREACQDEA